MKSVRHVNYLQRDNEVQVFEEQDVVILSSNNAYEKYEWCREYFDEKPKEGYFIWIRKTPQNPLITNILLCTMNAIQDNNSLIVVEKNVEAELFNTCAAIKEDLVGKHSGNTKFIVKENSKVTFNHFQRWGKEDIVESTMELTLKKGAEVSFIQKCTQVPKKFKMINKNYLDEDATLNYFTTVLNENGDIQMYDDTYLEGNRAAGISRVRLIAKKAANIKAHSRMIANSDGTGHLDCLGLLLANDSNIIAIPELINYNKDASLTHEASVGKISDEILNYLRSRGLTEDQAIDLVVTGFLGEEEDVLVDGNVISSKQYM